MSEQPNKPTIPSKKSNYPSSGVGAGMDRSVYVGDGEDSKSGRYSGKRSTVATVAIVVAISAAIVGIVALSMYFGLLP